MNKKKIFLPLTAIALFLIGFWSFNLFALLIILVTPILFLKYKSRIDEDGWQINLVDIGFIVVIIYEFLIYKNAINRYNSFSYLVLICNLFLYYFLVKYILLKEVKTSVIILFVAAYGFCLSLLTIFQYLAFNFSLSYEGFNDVNNFKHLYYPFGIFSNEWVTIMLLILPFSVASCFVIRSLKRLRGYAWVSLVITLFNIFTILISFSRGAYLSLILFLVLTILFFIFYHVLKPQEIIKYAILFVVLIAISVIPIRESVLTTASILKTESQQRSLESRKIIWRNSLTTLDENAFLGVGSNNFALEYSKNYDVSEDQTFTQRASNIVLKLWVEKGYLGLFIYGAFFVLFFLSNKIQLKKNKDNNEKIIAIIFCTGIFIMFIRDLSFSSVFENYTILFLATSILALFSEGKLIKIFIGEKMKLALILVTMSVWVWLMSIAILHFISESYYKSSIMHLKRNELTEAQASINKCLHFCSSNPQYFAQKGLINYKLASVSGDLFSPKINNKQYIIEAFSNYETALRMSPYDASLMHNLGWLFLLNKDTINAKNFLIKAVETDRNYSLYHISSGLMFEAASDQNNALKEYQEAIRMNLEILDSKFFSDLRFRFPDKYKILLDRIKHDLNGMPNNSIVEAKLAKLYLISNDLDKSEILLEKVNNELPNLNRVWYHLGIVKENKGDTLASRKMFLHSYFLDNTDFLPALKLAEFYFKRSKKLNAIVYYKQVLKSWLSIQSNHSVMVNSIYRVPGYSNDIIPQDLVPYIEPHINVNEICSKIALCYKSLHNDGLYDYYKNLALKDCLFLKDVK